MTEISCEGMSRVEDKLTKRMNMRRILCPDEKIRKKNTVA